MNMQFEVSPKKWKALGLPLEHMTAINNAGFKLLWDGSKIFMSNDEEVYGDIYVKAGMITSVDLLFRAKYKELTGSPFYESVGVKDSNTSDAFAEETPKDKAWPKPHEATVSPDSPAFPDGVVRLRDAKSAGQKVQGTNAVYTTCLISDDANLAYRLKQGSAGGLSIRAEGYDQTTRDRLVNWGFTVKGDGPDGYASVHLSTNDLEVARRTLGSIQATILTKAPEDVLYAKDVK